MGCIISLFFKIILGTAKFVAWLATKAFVSIFRYGLAVPLLLVAGFVFVVKAGYILSGTWQFDVCCIALAILTVTFVAIKCTRNHNEEK